MITKIQFQKDARVVSADGKQVGSLERVVVNPETNVITSIVVRIGTLISHEEKVVPIGFVAETGGELIVLRDEAGELESLPPFEERHLLDESGVLDPPPQSASPSVYGYPGVGTSVMNTSSQQLATQVEQNIPDGTVAMKEGAKVITLEGKHVGNVERVLADPTAEQVTHLLISRGMFSKETKLIPMKWVMRLGEEKIHLRVRKDSVDQLEAAPLAG